MTPRVPTSLVAALCVSALVALSSSLAPAVEPVQPFLEGLRRRQMYDIALEYLATLRDSPLVTDEVKQTLLYEEGQTLVEEARTLRDVTRRMEQLDTARQRFEEFIASQPQHALVSNANLQLGNVIVERGRTLLVMAERPAQAANKEQLTADARQQFADARKVFDAAQATLEVRLAEFPVAIDRQQTAQIEARKQVRNNLIQAKLLSAMIGYELAKTHPPDSGPYKQGLEEAAALFEGIYKDYRQWFGGLYARMWQANCLQDLGDTKRALTYYGELLAQPDEPDEFRVLKRKSLRLAMLCWLSEQEQKVDEAINQGTAWLTAARGSEDRSVEGLAIRWLVAQAYLARAETAEGAPADRDRKSAYDIAQFVARYPGDHQADAKQLLASRRKDEGEQPPANFAEALTRGQTAVDAMSLAEARLAEARSSGASSEQLAEHQARRDQAVHDAVEIFGLALRLRDDETSIDDVNRVRYFLCYLNYQQQRYYDAAVLGEFLVRNYPKSAGARPAATTAMASYLQAYNRAPAAERQFETQRMAAIAELITQQWPGGPEADDAWMILGDVALRAGQLDRAAEYLAQIPDDSPRRGKADLKEGQALWANYLAALARSPEDRPPASQLDERLKRAETLLARGVARMHESPEGGASADELLTAELSLAQLYVTASQNEAALAILARPETGPLAQIRAQVPAATRGNVPIEAFKAALRAYVGTQQLDDAERIMGELEQLIAERGEGDASLTQIYVGLGQELEQQVGQLGAENKIAERDRLLAGLKTFLDRIAAGSQGNTYRSLIWVAETSYRLGEGLAPTQPQEAAAYYQTASRGYQQILLRGESDEGFTSPETLLAVRVQLARCQRSQGKFKEALNQLLEVIRARPNSLEAQLEAAYAFQEWAAEDSSRYALAIRGYQAKSEPPAHIWGWGLLARKVQSADKFQETFYEANYNLASCTYEQAMTQSGAAREQSLASAGQLITTLARTHPELGGDAWRLKFDRLLRQIQRAAGGRATGLDGVLQAAAARTGAAP